MAALTLTTAKVLPSIWLVTQRNGTAVRAHEIRGFFVPKAYLLYRLASRTSTSRVPLGQEVHAAVLYAKEHFADTRGISAGSGCQSSLKLMFPQWQLPWMSIEQASDGGSQRVTSKASAQRTTGMQRTSVFTEFAMKHASCAS